MERSTLALQSLPRIRRILLHACCWAVFILYEQATLVFGAGLSTLQWQTFCFYGINVLLFYVNYQLLNRVVSLDRVNYRVALLYLVAELLSFMVLKAVVTWLFSSAQHTSSISFFQALQLDLFRSIYFAGLSTLVWVGKHLETFRQTSVKARISQLEAESAAAQTARRLSDVQNALLQQQLNPHLLFNTLSFVHSAVYPYSEAGAQCLLLLSDILRYGFESAGPDGQVPLDQEITQVRNLAAINRYRFGEAMPVAVLIQAQPIDHRIIPLVLLTLTENVFKHGVVNNAKKPATISIHLEENGLLTFHSSNWKRAATTFQRTRQIGLRNLRTRLDYTYGDKAVLTIHETEDQYELTLHLQL